MIYLTSLPLSYICILIAKHENNVKYNEILVNNIVFNILNVTRSIIICSCRI